MVYLTATLLLYIKLEFININKINADYVYMF